jgi:hypothetical protein
MGAVRDTRIKPLEKMRLGGVRVGQWKVGCYIRVAHECWIVYGFTNRSLFPQELDDTLESFLRAARRIKKRGIREWL